MYLRLKQGSVVGVGRWVFGRQGLKMATFRRHSVIQACGATESTDHHVVAGGMKSAPLVISRQTAAVMPAFQPPAPPWITPPSIFTPHLPKQISWPHFSFSFLGSLYPLTTPTRSSHLVYIHPNSLYIQPSSRDLTALFALQPLSQPPTP